MGFLKQIEENDISVDMISAFGGYEHKLIIDEGKFYDAKNLTVNGYPLAKTRDKRKNLTFNVEKVIGMAGKENLLVAYEDIGAEVCNFTIGASATTIPGVVRDDGAICTPIDIRNAQWDLVEQLTRDGRYWYNGKIYWVIEDQNKIFPFQYNGTFMDNGTKRLYWKWDIPGGNINNDAYLAVGKVSSYPNSTLAPYHIKIMRRGSVCTTEAFANYIVGKTIRLGQNDWRNTSNDATITNVSMDKFLENDDDEICEYRVTAVDTIQPSYCELTIEPIGDATHIHTLISSNAKPLVYLKIGKLYLYESAKSYENNMYTVVPISYTSSTEVQKLQDSWVQLTDGQTIYIHTVDTSNSCVKVLKPNGLIAAGTKVLANKMYLAKYNIDSRQFENVTAIADFEDTTTNRRMVEMGAYVLIFPEKIMVNTTSLNSSGQFNDIKKMELSTTHYCSPNVVDSNGNSITIGTVGPTCTTTTNGYVWLDTSNDTPIIKRYDTTTYTWHTFQAYLKILTGGSTEWSVGDAVELNSAFDSIIKRGDQKYWVIYKVDNTGITIPVTLQTNVIGYNYYTLSRNIPDMDYMVECNNRLWGCKYGNVNGSPINEIFASKLGDPCNFHYFANTSMDSYYVSLGDDGAFTGAVTYQSNPCFFKEDCVHRIYGSLPSNFQLKTTVGYGCEKGSWRSAIVMNDVVYYHSPVGPMAYNGGTPTSIADALGNVKYKDAVSGTIGHKLYMCMKDKSNTPHLFVYDDYYQMWMKEDNLNIGYFFNWANECYGLSMDTEIWAMQGIVPTESAEDITESDFEFNLTSGNIGYSSQNKKYLLKLVLRLAMPITSKGRVEIQYDSDGVWHKAVQLRPNGKPGSIDVPIMPRRCDHFAIRIVGVGQIALYSIAKYYESGSDF